MLDSSKYPTIPQVTINTINNYVEHGLEPGSFVRSVLANNLFDAVGSADMWNLAVLPDIVRYVYNECPFDCWGSKNVVDTYLMKVRDFTQSNAQEA